MRDRVSLHYVRKKDGLSYILLFMVLFMSIVMLINNHGITDRRIAHNRPHNNIDNNIEGRRRLDEQSIASNEIIEKESSDNGEDEVPPCGEILLQETTGLRCAYANNCDGEFLMTSLLPLVFCTDPSKPSSLDNYPVLEILFPILFPIGLVLLTLLLFRLLGSTAENYFSPALEMISSEFQIPPALAGVTLLALGNGAPDISAVVNAIKTNAQEGIPLSLGELTGGGMFVQSVVVGRIVMLGSSNAGGITCGKELIRDISMYTIAAGFVFWTIERGRIHYRHVVTMLLLYFGYVTIVVFSELRRYNNADQIIMGDEANDIEADSLVMSPSLDEEDDQAVELAPMKKLHNCQLPDPPGSKHSSRVPRVIKRQQERHYQRQQEKRKSLSDTGMAQDQSPPKQTISQSWSLELLYDALVELGEHFYQTIHVDILSNKLLSKFEWHCMLMEIPFIIIRKFAIPIPCEEEYNRSMVAFSIAFSPFWLLYYLSTKSEEGVDARLKAITIIISFVVGATVIRFCDKATGMPLKYGIVIALYGFLIAATWIDVISEQLVSLLELIGILLRIPSPVMGMTILAWGNSVGDWTTNGALASRGLADMR
jgi:sodium/potassium/calcium exchanger 6